MSKNEIFYATIDKAIDFEGKKARLVFKRIEDDYGVLVLAITDEDPFTSNFYITEEILLFLKYKDKVARVPFKVEIKTTGAFCGPLPYTSRANIEKNEDCPANVLNKVVESLGFYEEIDYKSFYMNIRGFLLASDKEEFLDTIFDKKNSIMGETFFSQAYNLIKRKAFSFLILQSEDIILDPEDEKRYWELVRYNDDIKISIEMEYDKVLVQLYKGVANNIIMKQYYPIEKAEGINGLTPILPIKEIAIDIRKSLLLYIPEKELSIQHYHVSQGLLKNELQIELEVVATLQAYLLHRKRRIHGTFWDFGMKEILTREIPEGYIK